MRYTTLILASIALVGCNEKQGTSDIDDKIQEKRGLYASPIEPAPDYKTFKTYDYQNGYLRGPFEGIKFEPLVSKKSNTKTVAPDPNRVKEKLEQFHTDGFSMVGTLGDKNTKTAILKYNDGSYYNVKKGDYIGQNHGQIEKIDDTFIKINEIVGDGLGGWEEREVVLGLLQVDERLIDKETADALNREKEPKDKKENKKRKEPRNSRER